ncbi:MAG: coproporphyrinogen-III oxidase family protein, partial [Chloroflexota bacterium]
VTGLDGIFTLTELIEATVEVNPESATPEFYRLARAAGINRVSVGVQSLSGAELGSVGRIHTSAQAISALVNAKQAGFAEISADVIVGLPGQDWGTLYKTLDVLVKSDINHLSLYCLSIEEGTPLAENVPQNLPSDDMQSELFERSCELLAKAGFWHYEISNFARSGHECNHNLNYWRGGEYLGLGVAAASHINGWRFKNRSDLCTYLKDPAGQITEIEDLDAEAKACEEAMLRLRLVGEGLDINELSKKFEGDNTKKLELRLKRLSCEGLLISENSRYRLAPSKVLVSNPILARVIGD